MDYLEHPDFPNFTIFELFIFDFSDKPGFHLSNFGILGFLDFGNLWIFGNFRILEFRTFEIFWTFNVTFQGFFANLVLNLIS